MNVEVLLFAQLREAVGESCRRIRLDEGATVADALDAIRRWPEWDAVRDLPLTFAVNERVSGADHRLRDGDRLALLTPVQGG